MKKLILSLGIVISFITVNFAQGTNSGSSIPAADVKTVDGK